MKGYPRKHYADLLFIGERVSALCGRDVLATSTTCNKDNVTCKDCLDNFWQLKLKERGGRI